MSNNVLDKMNIEMSEHGILSDLFSLLENDTRLGYVTAEINEFREKHEGRNKEFEDTLSEHQKKQYNDLEDISCDELHILVHEAFICGYKMATRLLVEGLK